MIAKVQPGGAKGVVLAALLAALAPAPAAAYVAAPAGGEDGLEVRRLDVVVVRHGRRTDLMVGLEYVADERPEALGWVIPTPSRADAFERVDGAVLGALARIAGGGQPAGKPVRAGPYPIQRMRGRGADAAKALASWIDAGGYAVPPEAAVRYYAERGWHLLAARVPPRGKRLPPSGRLPPLRVSFRSDRAVAPLKLAGPGRPALRLWLLTAEPLAEPALQGARERGLVLVATERIELAEAPDPITAFLRGCPAWPGDRDVLHVRHLKGEALGQGELDPARWDEDLAFPAVGEGERLTATMDHQRPLASAGQDEPASQPEGASDEAAAPKRRQDTGGCGCEATAGDERVALGGSLLVLALLGRRRRARCRRLGRD